MEAPKIQTIPHRVNCKRCNDEGLILRRRGKTVRQTICPICLVHHKEQTSNIKDVEYYSFLKTEYLPF